MLVRRAVVDDQVDVEECGHRGVQMAQEREEFLMPGPGRGLPCVITSPRCTSKAAKKVVAAWWV